MTLYTFISEEELNILNETGKLVCDPSKVEPFYINAYDFMSSCLEKKCPKPDKAITYPRWAWYSWENSRNVPDTGILEFYPDMYLLEIDVPDNEVLLSDYDNWHFCLNYIYLPKTDEEDDWFESQKPYLTDDALKKRIRNSWLNIFDKDFPNRFITDENEHSVQAVFWILYKNQVKKITYIKGREEND